MLQVNPGVMGQLRVTGLTRGHGSTHGHLSRPIGMKLFLKACFLDTLVYSFPYIDSLVFRCLFTLCLYCQECLTKGNCLIYI